MQSPAALFTASPDALEDHEDDSADSASTDNNNDEEKKANGNAEMEDATSKSSSGGENDDTNHIGAANAIRGNVVKEETMKPETNAMDHDAEADDTGYFSTKKSYSFSFGNSCVHGIWRG